MFRVFSDCLQEAALTLSHSTPSRSLSESNQSFGLTAYFFQVTLSSSHAGLPGFLHSTQTFILPYF